MGYKIKNTIRKSKATFIILAVLWVILSIVLVSALTISITDATVERNIQFGEFYTKYI
ncbi:MAG: hypothetical protein Q4G09_03105 [Clostridia bacterium]|nr:hypothetical protein [Clostridia bacterium]